MKPIIISLLISFNCYSQGFHPVGKEGANTFYVEKSVCESIEGQECFDSAKCPLEECELVDNDALDYIKKVDAVSCELLIKPEGMEGQGNLPESTETFNEYQDCDDKFEALVCNGKQEKIKSYDQLEVYCAKPIMKIDGKKLAVSETKKATKLLEVKLAQDLEISNKLAKKALKQSIKNDIKDANNVAKLKALVEKLIELQDE